MLLQVPSSIEKVAEMDVHIGVAMSGLTADARTLIDHGRIQTQAGLPGRNLLWQGWRMATCGKEMHFTSVQS